MSVHLLGSIIVGQEPVILSRRNKFLVNVKFHSTQEGTIDSINNINIAVILPLEELIRHLSQAFFLFVSHKKNFGNKEI